MTRSGDLRLFHLQDITRHYPLTLQAWRRAFQAKAEDLAAMGFDERFRRLWEFYFAYCEAGFRERTIGTVQMLLTRPAAEISAPIPQD
jgi:cyclopropane-fatty-acyl-phospholipid synthase